MKIAIEIFNPNELKRLKSKVSNVLHALNRLEEGEIVMFDVETGMSGVKVTVIREYS